MSNITATVVVQFSNSGNGILTAEIDSRPDGYNGGRSSFSTGDEPVILVRKSANVSIDQVLCSQGSASQYATGFTEEEEFLTYVNSKQASASKVISSAFSSEWYGNNLGIIKTVNQKDVVIDAVGAVSGVGVLGITYRSDFIAYKLSGIPSTVNGKKNFNVLVAFIASVTD